MKQITAKPNDEKTNTKVNRTRTRGLLEEKNPLLK